MQQVVIATRQRGSEAVIAALQDAGVLHLKPITGGPLSTGSLAGGDAQSRREDERLLARAESTIAELGAYRPAPAPLPPQEDWERVVEEAAGPVSALARSRQELQADLDAEATYGDAVRTLARLSGGVDRSRRLTVVPFLLQPSDSLAELEAALQGTLKDRYALTTDAAGPNRVGLIAVLRGDRDAARAALSRVRLGELRLPGRFDSLSLSEAALAFDQIRGQGPERQRLLNEQREALARTHGPVLYAVRDALKDRVAIHDVRAVSARGKYSLAMQGYVPVDRVPALTAALGRFGDAVAYEIHPVDEHHDLSVPVELKNGGYVRPFQLFMGLMSPPRYGTFDPTWVMSIFIPLFFGIIIADIGYGLLFLAFGMWLLGKARRNEGLNLSFMGAYVPPATLRDLGFVTNVMAFWSIVWGFLTGEFFGTLLEKLGLFYFDADLVNRLWGWTGITAVPHEEHSYPLPHLIPIVFPRLEIDVFANVALVFALLFGVLQVLWGWGIRMQQGIKHRDPVHTWEGLAMLGGLSGLVLMAFATQAGRELGAVTDFGNPLVWLMWVGFAVFLLGYARVARKVPLLIMELISQGGAIISYARIFAVGLVSAVLAKLSTETGMGLAESLGPLGIIVGLLVGILLHAVILALTMIGHILQPIRLHLLEFLNPTGFHNEASPSYNPLRRLSPAAPAAGQVK